MKSNDYYSTLILLKQIIVDDNLLSSKTATLMMEINKLVNQKTNYDTLVLAYNSFLDVHWKKEADLNKINNKYSVDIIESLKLYDFIGKETQKQCEDVTNKYGLQNPSNIRYLKTVITQNDKMLKDKVYFMSPQ